ncbi:MAG: hypothetical protein II814_09880, partial [Treponema sp.]|nr:hypothetical protein [Treponema sp.]
TIWQFCCSRRPQEDNEKRFRKGRGCLMSMTGSQIAKGGFANEQDVAEKLNNWKNDADAKELLEIMSYNLDEI